MRDISQKKRKGTKEKAKVGQRDTHFRRQPKMLEVRIRIGWIACLEVIMHLSEPIALHHTKDGIHCIYFVQILDQKVFLNYFPVKS